MAGKGSNLGTYPVWRIVWQDRNNMRHPVLCDLDGVIWLGDEPIEGSAAAVADLRRAGHRVLFVTNFSFAPVEETERKLARHGIPARGDVVTSAQAAAHLVSPGERVMVFGGPGIDEAVAERGADTVTEGPADAVIVGFHRSFDFSAMTKAATAVRAGARLIGTNDDATYPTHDGPIPGGGAILASVAVASGVSPLVAGKPHHAMADLVRGVLGGALEQAVMVGDRADTDGLFAQRLGCRYAQVWSGVTPQGSRPDPTPDLTGANLADIARQLLHTF